MSGLKESANMGVSFTFFYTVESINLPDYFIIMNIKLSDRLSSLSLTDILDTNYED